MKTYRHLRTLAVLLAGLMCACLRVGAQDFGLSVISSASSILVDNSVTFTINLTNLTTSSLLQVLVTNTLPASVQVQTIEYATNSNVGTVSAQTNGSVTVFHLNAFAPGGRAQLFVTAQLTAAGFVTNFVTAISQFPSIFATNSAVVQVTNPVSSEADLGVTIAGPAQTVIANDWMTYEVTVTNLGPATAPNVTLTNFLPPSALLESVSPSSPGYSLTSSNMIFNLGALASGDGMTFQFTIQPTNTGPLTLAASGGVTGLVDTNTANNSASVNVSVTNFIGTLIATNISMLGYDPQTGLMTNTIRLSNLGTNAVPSARVIVSGLTNQLFNAVGTNGGNPYVVYANTLDTNQSVDLLMEYFIPTRLPITISNSQYAAVGVPKVTFPAPGGTNGVFDITLITNLPDGSKLIEFQSIPGRNYTVQYSDNDVTFSNALEAQPSITAPADRTQWIDDGPPKTVSPPSSVSQRYYRVLLNPP